MNVNKAYEAENGFLVENGPFYTGGSSSPVGLDLPTKTLYLQTTASGILLWRKFNTGVNDWRQLSAQDIPFDKTGLKFNATDIRSALDELRNNTILPLVALTSSASGNYNVSTFGSNLHVVSGSATNYSVTLPDATLMFIGRVFEIVNSSSQTIQVKDNSGTVLANLISGDSGKFTLETKPNAAGTWLSVVITSAATGITSYVITSNTQFNTTSPTDALIAGFTVTPVNGRYATFFSSDLQIVSNNAVAEFVNFVDGSAVSNTRRKVQGVSSNFVSQSSFIGQINVNGAQAVDVRVNITSNTLRVNERSLVLIRLGQAT